jgi:hypothetical protein
MAPVAINDSVALKLTVFDGNSAWHLKCFVTNHVVVCTYAYCKDVQGSIVVNQYGESFIFSSELINVTVDYHEPCA